MKMSRQTLISLFFLGMLFYFGLIIVTWSIFPTMKLNEYHNYFPKIGMPSIAQQPAFKFPGEDNKIVCPFPIVNPYNRAVMEYIFEYPTVDCTSNLIMPSIVFLHRQTWLKVNKTKARQFGIEYEYCRYTPMKMENGSDFDLKRFEWSEMFTNIIHLKSDDEYVYVRCYNQELIVSRSFISRFIMKPRVEERASRTHQNHLKTKTPSKTLNILFIGIDGMSKQAFERSMPKTRNFLLNELKARELHRFNKVGQNTFPNIIPLLTGIHEEELLQQWSPDDYFDEIDHLFIWNEYKKAGYRTTFLTDVAQITAFHYMKRGWKNPPFDYFARPIPVKTEFEKDHGIMDENCIGDTPEVTHLLDYVLQMTTVWNDTIEQTHQRQPTPYFSYNFLTRLSHDFASLANRGDDLYLSFLHEIKRRNTLHNTVMVMFSDHGGRFGEVRKMYQGMLESRMPFVMFVFPRWFQEKYPDIMTTFSRNQYRLSTFFDIHATLRDLLHFSPQSKIEKEITTPKRGISLLREIPITRNCKDAGIPRKYCLCSRVQTAKSSQTITTVLVYTLYQYIISTTTKYRRICKQLELKKVVSILPVEMENEEETRSYYQVTIETFPGDAAFEATLSYDTNSYKSEVEGDIVRLNMYRGQDWCMNKPMLKPFCYCRKDSVTKK